MTEVPGHQLPPAPPPPKQDPETLVLRGQSPRVVRFRRHAIIGLAAATSTGLAGVAWYALKPASLHILAEPTEGAAAEPRPPVDTVNAAPATYADVPELGPPLPGDLGRPIVAHQRALGGDPADMPAMSPVGTGPDPIKVERQRRETERQSARASSVMVELTARSNANASDPGASPAVDPSIEAGSAGAPPANSALAQTQQRGLNPHAIQNASSPWTISAGTVIAASLITGLNSDLPGMVVAQVTENVHDSATGRTLLIPQGSRLIGQYESRVAYGQRRALVVWWRIIWPDGSSLQLDDMPATDGAGQAGIADRVDFHGGALLKGVALSTLLGIGTELSFGDDEDELVRALRESAQRDGARAGEQIVSRSLDIQPTITVRPGWPLRVLVTQDLVLKPWIK